MPSDTTPSLEHPDVQKTATPLTVSAISASQGPFVTTISKHQGPILTGLEAEAFRIHPLVRPEANLDVLEGSVYAQANVITYKTDGTESQKWRARRESDVLADDDVYSIVNAKTGRLLTALDDGTARDFVAQHGDRTWNGLATPRDASGVSASELADSSLGAARERYTARMMDPAGHDPIATGTNVCQDADLTYTPWATDAERLAQRWFIRHVGPGRYRISPVLNDRLVLAPESGGGKDPENVRLLPDAPVRTRRWSLERATSPAVFQQMAETASGVWSATDNVITVDTSSHYVCIFKGSQDRWDPVRFFACTNGAWATPTVTGTFELGDKGYYFDSEDGCRCFYYSQFYRDYLFHSTLYWPWSESPDYPMDATLGAYASHGCVRCDLSDAYYINKFVPSGTKVIVY